MWLHILLLTTSAFAQTAPVTGQITGVVNDPDRAAVSGSQVTLTNQQTKSKVTAVTDAQGGYSFRSLPPGSYVVDAGASGFKPSISSELTLTAGQTVTYDFALALAGVAQTVNVSAGAVENAYRVDTVEAGGPLGATPILDIPYSVNVISRQLIDDTQSRNFKEAAKYLPLVSFQEMQGPEVLRPETRGMQGSNMQNDRKDGMGIAVTTPSALEEYEQVEALTGVGGALYGPANPSGMFNFDTKRPTETPFREIELGYEGASVGTIHTDLGGRFGKNEMFGYRSNLLLADGNGYVTGSQLRRQLAAGAGDIRVTDHTVIEGNYSYYNLYQHGYPGWFAYTPTTTPLSNPTSKSILLPPDAPDPTLPYGQSFSGVDLTSKIGELRVKHDFSSSWHLVVGALDQRSDRNINTAVNQFVDNKGDYKSYLANSFSSLAPRFHVDSDLAYLTGRVRTGRLRHDIVIGSTGYRFASYSPVTSPAKTALCTANTPQGICQSNIAVPLVYVEPVAGIFSYTKTSPSTGIYGSSIIRQQGFSFSDSITLTPRWLVRLTASQDWTWTDSYTDSAATGYLKTSVPGGYVNQGVSPSASVMFKPRADMTIYGTFADSIQAPDVASANSGSIVIVNASQALPPYRSKEGEIGYKLRLRKINFSTALFRVERPFANYATGVVDPVCGAQSGTPNCEAFRITGNQVNYGVETMLSGRIFERLMVTGGLTILSPQLTDTGIAATNDKNFVGIPDYKSNILAEYHLPKLTGAFFNFDWQHVGRRPIDDINSSYTPQFNTFDFGVRYTTKILGKLTTWRVTANNATNVHYWSTLGPGSITGQSTGSYLGHLGEPRLVTASLRYDF
jgi:iron complex outermembrane recepter protein